MVGLDMLSSNSKIDKVIHKTFLGIFHPQLYLWFINVHGRITSFVLSKTTARQIDAFSSSRISYSRTPTN